MPFRIRPYLPRRGALLFLVAILVPCAVLIALGVRTMGWNVVNVEYRLGNAADATTLVSRAADDCALRFVAALPANFNIDKNRIVVTGESARGHGRTHVEHRRT